jgi:hypothetical protein
VFPLGMYIYVLCNYFLCKANDIEHFMMLINYKVMLNIKSGFRQLQHVITKVSYASFVFCHVILDTIQYACRCVPIL